MMSLNKFYNEDCFKTIERIEKENIMVDNVITSPFYNTSRSNECDISEEGRRKYQGRYDTPIDNMRNEDYVQFTVDLFNKLDNIIKENGSIIYNLNYGSENTEAIWLVVAEIIKKTNWTVADDIIWLKKIAIPNSTSPNKLTRIVEHIFVFCRKKEFKTFYCNKGVKSVSIKTGQKYYRNVYNIIEAGNNDRSCKLNKATFSTELVSKLIDLYVPEKGLVYDCFMGTGTTANACLLKGRMYIGSEISKAQCDYSYDRIMDTLSKMELK